MALVNQQHNDKPRNERNGYSDHFTAILDEVLNIPLFDLPLLVLTCLFRLAVSAAFAVIVTRDLLLFRWS